MFNLEMYLTPHLSICATTLQHSRGGRGSGFIPIAEYGSEFRKGLSKGKKKQVVKLLYSGRNHYDLLV